jgi:peptidoglycan/xylan/chitin deacetylase (PgdA/CDA1 family)
MELRTAGRAFQPIASILVIALTGILASCVRTAESPGAIPTHTEPPEPPVLSEHQAEDALATAQDFVTAATEKKYDRLWELLAPEVAWRWEGPAQFGAFIARKFGTAKINFDLGRLAALPDGRSVEFPLALRLVGDGERLVGPPLVLARYGESWAVSDPGPLGPRGPIIGAPQPVRPELQVPILIYHHVAPDLPREGNAHDTVTTEAFAAQLRWLADNGHATITVAELYNAFYYDVPLPPKPVILVFDDSYADVYNQAFPLLRDRGFGATVAAITGALDHPGYLTWDQAREMAAAGVEFVSHTVTHADLAVVNQDDARRELADSRRSLEENLGWPVQFFVYPFGQPFTSGSEEARQTVLALLREAGYAGALTTSSGPPYIALQRADQPYLLHRIPVSGGESVERFAASIQPTPSPDPGLTPPVE